MTKTRIALRLCQTRKGWYNTTLRHKIDLRGPQRHHFESRGKPATAGVASDGKLKLLNVGDKQFDKMDDNGKAFVEFLKSWGGKWMWDSLNLSEDPF